MSGAQAVPAASVASGRHGRSAALTAVGQIFVLLGASLIGLVVAARLSPGPRLDAYFTASQVSVAALYIGQALRTSVPGLQLAGVVRGDVLLRATLVMVATVAAVLLAAVISAPLLLPEVSRDAMRGDLLILLPGAVVQVLAGYGAGRLAMASRFAGTAGAYAIGTTVNAVLLVALIEGHGAEVLAPLALAGWLTSGTLIATLLFRSRNPDAGTAPVAARAATPSPAVGVLGASVRIILSVLPILTAQLVIVASVAAAASLQSGGSTLVSLAFLATNAVGTVAVGPISIVLAANLGVTWDRQRESLVTLILSVVRLSAAVTMPLVLMLLLIGRPIADEKLGGLSAANVDDLFTVIMLLLPSLPLTAASMVAIVAVVTTDRLGRLALALGVAAIGLVVSLALVVALNGSLPVLAIVASVWSGAIGATILIVALGRGAGLAIARTAVHAGAVSAPAIAVLIASTATDLTILTGIGWTLAGLLVHLAWLRWRHPSTLEMLLGAVRR